MNDPATVRIGTLGSSATFAGEATERFRERFAEFSKPLYFKSMEDCWRELAKGTVDAIVLGAERTGRPHHGDVVIRHGFHVMGMMALPLLCNLYVKPGARRESIRKITGHGSIFQCSVWLDQHFPGVPREMHGLNSVEAAKAALAGDGSEAVVGSRSLPDEVRGLELLAERIDDGSLSNWWVVSAEPHFAERPGTIVVANEFGPDGKLGEMIGSLAAVGYRLATIGSFPADHGISTYNYLATFDGVGRRADVERAITPFGARLVGAFTR